jgi:integrase/recombinase XerD
MQPNPNVEPVRWSVEKQRRLQEQLVGSWAEDVWCFLYQKNTQSGQRRMHFTRLLSPTLRIELKYAVFRKLTSGRRKVGHDPHELCTHTHWLIRWFNQTAPAVSSLLERSLEYWELSLRSALVQERALRRRAEKQLRSTQNFVVQTREDRRITLLRVLYKTIQDAYDDRVETAKDIWDVRKLGVTPNPTESDARLNFTSISQPWLRQLAKKFLEYDLALHPSGTGNNTRLDAIKHFSRFLAEQHPTLQVSGINRALLVSFLSYVRNLSLAQETKRAMLVHLRTFLETCAYRLTVSDLPRERLLFDEEFPKAEVARLPREIPAEVLTQLRQRLNTLPTTLLRMVTILLECGMRISELCSLSLDCLTHDDKHEWYLTSYLWKRRKEHLIPLVNQAVVGAIQAQQAEIRAEFGQDCPYLFPRLRSPQLPYHQSVFRAALNRWAVQAEIRDPQGALYHFTAHQFRHTVGMRLINDDVPIETISRLFGHASTHMTERYAHKRLQTIREELLRAGLKHKTIDFHGQVVKGDPEANRLEPQLLRKGIRGQTLPVGGCGRAVVMGPCDHANKCLTCVFWLTATEDLPALKAFLGKALRLRQRAAEAGNELVVKNQDQIIPMLQLRITSLEQTGEDYESFSLAEVLQQLKRELAELEVGLEEAREAQLVIGLKQFERRMAELQAQIAALEGAL